MRIVACSSATDAACLRRLALPFGSGKYWRLLGEEGNGLDTMDRGEHRWLELGMVEVATCHGMAVSLHKGRVARVRGCSIGL